MQLSSLYRSTVICTIGVIRWTSDHHHKHSDQWNIPVVSELYDSFTECYSYVWWNFNPQGQTQIDFMRLGAQLMPTAATLTWRPWHRLWSHPPVCLGAGCKWRTCWPTETHPFGRENEGVPESHGRHEWECGSWSSAASVHVGASILQTDPSSTEVLHTWFIMLASRLCKSCKQILHEDSICDLCACLAGCLHNVWSNINTSIVNVMHLAQIV